MIKKMLGFLVALFISANAVAGNKQFDTVVVLGDSLSDNGNLYRYLWYQLPLSPPYYEGRFSNGPVWIEQLYASLFPAGYTEGLQDYAVGGAGAVLSYKQNLPYTLTMELDNYLYWHTYGKKESTLYTIWIGGNNYLNGPTNVEAITDSVVEAIGNTVVRLIDNGGTKFLLPNLPDIGRMPYAVEKGNEQLLTQLVKVHNEKLAARVEALKADYPEVTFVYFDIHSFFNQALDHAADYGFDNTQEPCYFGGYTGWLIQNKPSDQQLQSYFATLNSQFSPEQWASIKDNPQVKEAASASYLYPQLPENNKREALNCDGHVFWDRVHPTTRAHYFIAEKAHELLDEAGVRVSLDSSN
jgi:phospholipase/lecithinase/hemolysin